MNKRKESFDKDLKENFSKLEQLKGSGYCNYPCFFRFSLTCCILWDYSLMEIMEMRLSMENQETNTNKIEIERIKYCYSLGFCLWVLNRFCDDFLRYVMFLIRENEKFDYNYIHTYFDKIVQGVERLDVDYPNISEDTKNFFEELGSNYKIKYFFRRVDKAMKSKRKYKKR